MFWEFAEGVSNMFGKISVMSLVSYLVVLLIFHLSPDWALITVYLYTCWTLLGTSMASAEFCSVRLEGMANSCQTHALLVYKK